MTPTIAAVTSSVASHPSQVCGLYPTPTRFGPNHLLGGFVILVPLGSMGTHATKLLKKRIPCFGFSSIAPCREKICKSCDRLLITETCRVPEHGFSVEYIAFLDEKHTKMMHRRRISKPSSIAPQQLSCLEVACSG